jgi:hypothetical protein
VVDVTRMSHSAPSTPTNTSSCPSPSQSTFRSLLEKINATDGVAEPYRVLWIIVDRRRAACDVMVSVGHELWHDVEVLRAIHQE